jgi:hypothetical protein
VISNGFEVGESFRSLINTPARGLSDADLQVLGSTSASDIILAVELQIGSQVLHSLTG